MHQSRPNKSLNIKSFSSQMKIFAVHIKTGKRRESVICVGQCLGMAKIENEEGGARV